MNKHTRQTNPLKKGFTLIELLTVIAIIAILSAILVPTIGQMRDTARKTADISKLRQIGISSTLFAGQNAERHVPSDYRVDGSTGEATLADIAGALAIEAGLNDSIIWTSESEPDPVQSGVILTDLTTTSPEIRSAISDGTLSFEYVANLTTRSPSTTPLAFTRIATKGDSVWEDTGVYGGEGGHVLFLGGNVTWYTDLTGNLTKGDGTSADSLVDAVENTTVAVPRAIGTPKIVQN